MYVRVFCVSLFEWYLFFYLHHCVADYSCCDLSLPAETQYGSSMSSPSPPLKENGTSKFYTSGSQMLIFAPISALIADALSQP